MIVVAMLCVLVAAVFFIIGWIRMLGAKAISAKHVSSIAEASASLGDFASKGEHICRVEGVIECDTAINSELDAKPCVYSHTLIVKESEQFDEVQGSKKLPSTKIRKLKAEIANSHSSVPFRINDGSAIIQIDPEGATVECESSVKRFEAAHGGSLVVGSHTLDLSNQIDTNRQKTSGYRLEEWTLVPGQKVHVLGELVKSDAGLVISKPKKGKHFIITVKSGAQVTRKARMRSTLFIVIGSISLAVALAMLVYITIGLAGGAV